MDDRKDLWLHNCVLAVVERLFLMGGNRKGFLESGAFNVDLEE